MDVFLLFVGQHSLFFLLPALYITSLKHNPARASCPPVCPTPEQTGDPSDGRLANWGYHPFGSVHGRTSRRDYSRKV